MWDSRALTQIFQTGLLLFYPEKSCCHVLILKWKFSFVRLVFINIYALEGYFKQKVSIFLLTFTELIIALNNSVFKYACQGELRLYIFFENFWPNDPM